MTSPSEAYAAWQREKRRAGTPLASFRQRFPFELDPFQLRACEALQEGRSVLVAAPTGAGKTVVGEFAVHLALTAGKKVFYTAPIKALSNQKHAELSRWLGAEQVGLLTGDLSVRPDAPVVVMTTEVLRNMLYAGSDTLEGLGHVVMDEVHYLADRLRGPVWEEVILHLPPEVRLVALSATVSNAEEFGAWLQEVRGETDTIVSETRPVPLWQHVAIDDEILDLFVDEDGDPVVLHGPGSRGDREINPVLLDRRRAALDTVPSSHGPRGRGRGRRDRSGTGGAHRPRGGHRAPDPGRHGGHRDSHRGGHGGYRSGGGAGAIRPVRRTDLLRHLDREALLPAIVFIFSRSGCEKAVAQCRQARLELTTPQERRTIRAVLDERLAVIGVEDEDVLGIPAFRASAMAGLAAHHAGMLPLLKSVVEELFAEGLIKAVFATETLALGINMPARSVVLERLVKFNGVEHADLTPGEYTQLTGRAGRRGIDTEGHAVVVAGPGFDPEAVASLASRRTYPLRSAFRPTANMAVNLLGRVDASRAREILEMSFAQFQSDRSVVGLARRARELEDTAADYASAVHCDRGDAHEYAQLRDRIAQREKELSRRRAQQDRDRTGAALRSLRRGEIVALPGGKRQGYGVVIDVDKAVLHGPRVTLLDVQGRLRTVMPADVPSPPAVIDQMRLPRPDRLGSAKVRRDTASALRQRLAGHDDDPRREVRRRAERTPSTAAEDPELQQLRAALREHPVHSCPDLEQHLRWIRREESTRKELRHLQHRIEGRTSSLARRFDRLCGLLVELGHLQREGEDLVPTERGLRLRHLFSERDLLISECLEHGDWAGLDAPGLAAVVSAAIHEPRRDERGAAELPPDPAVARALDRTLQRAEALHAAEVRHGLEPTDPPDPGLSAIIHRWARGLHVAAALGDSDLPAGDFVRHCRQVIDLLEQLTALPDIGPAAREAVQAVRRGIVAQDIDR
ncbi:DEAD/DEAH box helicase [Brachybacterium sp. EF45031]|uniref:DEAD/DEAH box helicase n=1 Tax=Brachybacterium sillae TaxID=2810536 RepID=UPI00217DEF53|nr:DEAD/DEAH box helicase [Brachybacterium sillae]MCS6710662.1 DEAD/DEAH box helicase [Brachybacterium sillae]